MDWRFYKSKMVFDQNFCAYYLVWMIWGVFWDPVFNIFIFWKLCCTSIDAFDKPLRLLHVRAFPAQGWELAIIGERLSHRKVTVYTPSHALDAKFSLIIVGWWRLRISDGKFVKHTTEMILWSMILTQHINVPSSHRLGHKFGKLIFLWFKQKSDLLARY